MQDITLMLVEDDKELGKRLGKILSRKIAHVFLFQDPIEALDKFEEINPDIVLTDIKMPHMNGLDMIAAIRNLKVSTPIIIASAFTNSPYFQKAIQLKVEHFLVKPIDVDELISELSRIMDKKSLNQKFYAQEKLLSEYKRIVDVSCLVSKADINGKITYVNNEFSKLSGYSREELIGQSHNIVRHPDTPPAFFKRIWKTILNKEIWQGTIKNRTKRGESYYVKTTISPILDENNEIVEFISLREDVTTLINSIEKAQDLEKEKKDYIALIDDNIITSSTDLNGIITSVSTEFCRVSQYSPEELIGQSYHILRHVQMSNKVYENLWETIKKDQKWEGEIENLTKDGSAYWVETSILPVSDANGKKIGYTAIQHDITDKKRVEELSITDYLTGLSNRLKLDDILGKGVSQCIRYAIDLSIILVDIDYFKQVNDTHGHLVGDQILQKISSILSIGKRETDTVGRWGGEEFLMILPNTDIEGTRVRAEKIRAAVESHTFPVIKKITVSIGIAGFQDNDTPSSLVKRADDALYKAKEMGRNRIIS